jgi:hypothetical protein
MPTTAFSRTVTLLVFAGALVACGQAGSEAKNYPFTLRAESDPGEPMAGVQLLRSGKVVANSDINGYAGFTLAGEEGLHVTLGAGCPPGTSVFESELTTTLRGYQADKVPELLVRCSPNERELTVVAMFEHGAGLAIQHRLKTLAVTDEDGVAHFALRGKPGETFELRISTDAQPGLRPANPGASLTLGGRDEAQLLERRFILPPAKPRPRSRGAILPRRI